MSADGPQVLDNSTDLLVGQLPYGDRRHLPATETLRLTTDPDVRAQAAAVLEQLAERG